jgi:hypothetical protein
MSGMYPNNQTIEIFGEEVQWPGVDASGKFTNGSFSDPMVKPSFIPAQTLNLILDNLEELVKKCNEAPDSTTVQQLARLVTPLIRAHKIIRRDAQGRAKVAAPQAIDDIARLEEVPEAAKRVTPAGFGLYREGRDLKAVPGVSTIPDAFAALRERCNGTGTPDFSGLQIGDYLDGIDLSAIPAGNGGTAGRAWNDTYKNNRLTLSAFNPYKGVGDTEVTKNHIRFDFANVPLRKRMNPTDANAGGYAASEMRVFLEGANGDGTGSKTGVTTAAFLNALKAQIGDYILPVRRLFSNKTDWGWILCSLWLPGENEVFGANAFGEVNYGDGQKLHIPLYRDSYAHRIKRHNGSRDWFWLCTPFAGSAAYFCSANYFSYACHNSASAAGGCAPDSVRCNTTGRLRPIHPTQKEKMPCGVYSREYSP